MDRIVDARGAVVVRFDLVELRRCCTCDGEPQEKRKEEKRERERERKKKRGSHWWEASAINTTSSVLPITCI